MSERSEDRSNGAVDVLVVAFRSAPTLPGLLDDLLRDPSVARVVVVDNSRDEATRQLCEQRDRVRYLASDNVGFAAACELGARLRSDRASFVAVVNPDVRLARSIAGLLPLLREGAAVVAGRLTTPGERGVNSKRRITPAREVLRAACGDRRAYELVLPADTSPRRVAQVDGAFMVLAWTAWDALGGFDRSYELYYEDVDLCERAGALGGVWLAAEHYGTHEGGVSSRSARGRSYVVMRVSRVRYLRGHFGAAGVLAAAAAAVVEYLARTVSGRPEGGRARHDALRCQLRELVRPGSVTVLQERPGRS